MQIFGKREIEKFIDKHAISKNALEKWMDTVDSSEWKSHNDVKQIFPSADYIGNAKYVFNIKGNGFRIVAVVVFVAGTVIIRFIGTHEEYNRIDCKTI
jgi:mRNA interferase HigB